MIGSVGVTATLVVTAFSAHFEVVFVVFGVLMRE